MPNVKISIHKPKRKKLNEFERLSIARAKVNNLIMDAGACESRTADCLTYTSVLMMIILCAIPVVPGFKKSLNKIFDEEALSTTNLFIFISLFLAAGTVIQGIKHCRRNKVVLNEEQNEVLIAIINRYHLPIAKKLYPEPIEVLKAITKLERQLERQQATRPIKLFDGKKSPAEDIKHSGTDFKEAPPSS